MTVDFLRPGTIKGPGLIGRGVRIAFGIGCLFYFVWTLVHYSSVVSSDVPDAGWWVGAGVSFWLLPDIVNVGLTRSWGRLPQLAIVMLALVLVVVDLAAYESLWERPLGWLVFLLILSVFGPLGLSFILAGVAAVPG